MSPQDGGVAAGIGWVAVVGVATLGMARGGLDVGTVPGNVGAWGLLGGLCVSAVVALAAAVAAHRVAWGRPAVLGVSALVGLTAWSALSIAWASAPDRAWLSTHRAVSALAVLILAICLARIVRNPVQRLAVGLTLAASAVLVWALATRVLPELFAPLDDDARLAAPIGHANALGLLAVFAVPGALVLSSQRRWHGPSVALLGLAFVVLGLTGSRSGLLALAGTLVLALWLLPGRAEMLAASGAAVAGAATPVAYALLSVPLSSTPLPDPSQRRWESLLLGAAVVVGLAMAPFIRDLLDPAAVRLASWMGRPRAGRMLLAAGAAVVVAGGALAALSGRSASAGAGRTLSLDTNNRTAWWGQAWRGFTDAPLRGHGAGSFVLTNIAERTDDLDALRVRQPHQIVLELLSELGVVGLLLALVGVGTVLWAARQVGRPAGPALCVFAAFLIQAQLDIPWTVPAVSLAAVAAGGVILAMASGATRARGPAAAVRLPAIAMVAVAAVVSAVAYGVGLHRVNAASAELTRGHPQAAISPSRAAARINRLGISSLMIEAKARLQIGDQPGAVRAATRSTERQPKNPFAWECLAEVTTGTERTAALTRVAELDPRREPTEAPLCQPSW